MTSRTIAGVILAGGLSRRMGADKATVLLASRPLLDHVIERFRPQVDVLLLSGSKGRLAGHGLPVVADPLPGHAGPLAGILAAMRWVEMHRPEASHLASAPCDTPFLPHPMVARLASAAAAGVPAVARSEGRRHAVCGVFPVALAENLAEFLGSGGHKVGHWLDQVSAVPVDFPSEANGLPSFLNVNTPEDLARAEAALARQGLPAR